MADEQKLPRIAILLSFHGGISDVRCDCVGEPLDVVIATRRKDGHITGRPITMLATPDHALVTHIFELADPILASPKIRTPDSAS